MESKNSISRLILEKLAEAGSLTLDAVFPSNRVEGRVWRSILGLHGGYEFSKPAFSVALSRLKEQGLVTKTGGKRFARWIPTAEGEKKLMSYNMEPAKSDGIPRLVMYDVPELERKKRDRLRYALAACHYQQLQRSVWLGYCPLPVEFVKSLKDLNLKDKVHIVSVHKTGTLREF